MARVLLFIRTSTQAWFLLPPWAQAPGSANYEPTYPPRIMPAATDARLFYVEFRAREEAGGFGHSYITLGVVGLNGETRQTVIAGFMPMSMIDDYWRTSSVYRSRE